MSDAHVSQGTFIRQYGAVCPGRTPAPLVRAIVALPWRKRLGPVAIGARLGVPASTVHAVLVRSM